ARTSVQRRLASGVDLIPSVIELPSTTTDPGPPETSTPVSSGQVVTSVPNAPGARSPVWSPGSLRYDRCSASACRGASRTVPGRWRLTSRSVSAGTSKPSGSLYACAPAGTTTSGRPRKLSRTGSPRAPAPDARTATVAPPMRTGRSAKVFSSRTRIREPPAEVCTTSRSVRSVHGPTLVLPDVDAAQLPLQPRETSRTDSENTCRSRARGSRTEATDRPGSSGTVRTYSRAFSSSRPSSVLTCGRPTACSAGGPVRQSGAVSRKALLLPSV